MLEIGQEGRADAGRLERSMNIPLVVDMFFDEPEDLMHLGNFAFHAGDLADTHDPAPAVGQAYQLDQQADRGCDLTSNTRGAYGQPGHAYHLLEPLERITRRIRVHRRHRSFMTGVHGLEHVEGLLAATLADDDTVGTHPKGILDELALADLASALGIRRPGLHPQDMRELKLQFGGVLYGDEPLLRGNVTRQRVQHRRLAGSGAARDDQRYLPFH